MVVIYCFDNSIKKIDFNHYHNKSEFWEKYFYLKFNLKNDDNNNKNNNKNNAFTQLNEKINYIYNFNKQK